MSETKSSADSDTTEKARVIDHSGMYPSLNRELQTLLFDAELMFDALEVVAIIQESPRFKRHMCKLAQQRIEAAQKLAGQYCETGDT